MRISLKADYAVRGVVELAALSQERPIKAESLALAQDIPLKFLLTILFELTRTGIVTGQRGGGGGFRLARGAEEITIAEIVRAIDGPLTTVGRESPSELEYRGSAEPLVEVWTAVSESVRLILESVTVADIASNNLSYPVGRRTLSEFANAELTIEGVGFDCSRDASRPTAIRQR